MSQGKAAAVILAAGKGTRMKSDLPKVMSLIGGRPLIHYVLDATLAAGIDPGGTSSITSLTGTFTGSQAGKYSIADDGLGTLISTFTPGRT